ncbi:uncharacterized protein RAG0_08605 [Rhynchosporium agropyri]|uniref:Uncharacterized protein n=1 Tax=Rhynchosporium agropyri TaxID=914238 RepID=A0A1E1KRL2_9HELO|nr:uncharacterized protein RAG0_08605 [Rhynchosporium agropyri]
MILNIAQSTSGESSLAIALTLPSLEEVEEVYSDNSSSIKESLESLLSQISCIVLNTRTRIIVKVDDSEIIASRDDPEDPESEPITTITLEELYKQLIYRRPYRRNTTKKSKSGVTLVSLIEDITNEISLKYTLENYFIINKQKKKEFKEKSRKKPLRLTRIRSCIIKVIKTDNISPVYLYSSSKLNKLGGYLYSSILYTSKEKEIYIINKNLFIIKEETSSVSYSYASIFLCAYSTRKILLEESTLYTLEQDRRAKRSIYIIIDKPEILLAYIYIANLTSTSRVERKTPFECF